MNVRQTAERLHFLTGKQAKEIIGVLERWGYKDITVGHGVVTPGKNKLISGHPSDKAIHLSIEASFYGDGV
jgi:hypothetical protein